MAELREILEYVYSCNVRSDKQNKNRILDQAIVEIKSLIKSKLPKEKELKVMVTDYRYYNRTPYFIQGYNNCLTEIEKIVENL